MKLKPELEAYLQHRFQHQASDLIAALDQSSPTSLRINPAKSKLPVDADRVAWTETGLYLPERPIFTLDPNIHAGAYYVQEASSMFLETVCQQVLPLEEDLKVLDLCAAPGGKSTHLLSLLSPGSLLVANEVIRSRANILVENIAKWGRHNAFVSNNDPRDFQLLEGFFDVIVVDAPCSGEGMFRKDTKAIKEWSPAHVQLCADRQRRILMDVWDALKPGGHLIYSTCTYNPKENEENLNWLMQQVEASSIPVSISPDWGVEEIQLDRVFGYGLYPHHLRGEGLFMSVLQKEEGRDWQPPRRKKGQSYFSKPSKTIAQQVNNWVRNPEQLQMIQVEEQLVGLPKPSLMEAESLYRYLRIRYGGISLAEVKRKDIRPAHPLALYTGLNPSAFSSFQANKEEALTFLRKKPWALSLSKGWHLIQFEDLGIGWVKAVPGRINNYYPQHWRIRM